MSVAGQEKKGKSNLMQDSRRLVRERPYTRVAAEIPHQQDNEEHDGEHEKAEAMTRSIGTADW